MANKLYEETHIKDIADAIREKNKGTGTYTVAQMGEAIRAIECEQPTPFTNILTLDTTIVKSGYRVTSTGYATTIEGVAIVCPCMAGTHRIRVRGKYVWGYLQANRNNSVAPYYINFYKATSTPTDSTFAGTIINDTTNWINSMICQDEYGDWFLEFTMPSDGYIGFTLKDMSLLYDNGTFNCDPIITIDEPIGNGGVV